jgi:ecotin
MAVDPNAPKVERFITLGGEPYLLRYNSLLPIVVYVREGVEARHRIWSAGAEAKAVDEGGGRRSPKTISAANPTAAL